MAPRTIAAFLAAMLMLLAACGGSLPEITSNPSATRSPTPAGSGGHRSVTPSPITSTTPGAYTYLVQTGDTLAAIADLFGVSVDDLMTANGITDPTTLQAGQTIIIPGVAPMPTPIVTPEPSDSSGITILQLVDKQHPLPSGYAPPGLVPVTGNYLAPGYSASMRSDALSALVQMLDAAELVGYDIRVVSAYRSYQEQQTTYDYWVGQLGEAEANRVSAKAGYSEHQLGTTTDLGTADFGWDLTAGFGATPAGKWLAANSATYGFVMSYPDGKEPITGYAYEPWHFRYIGVDKAQAWQASGLTLNQFLGS